MSSDFSEWVKENFVPVVLTTVSEEVERLCAKNDLSFDQLLNGFSILRQLETPIRTVSSSQSSSQSHSSHYPNLQTPQQTPTQLLLHDFRMQFLPVQQFHPPTAKQNELLLQTIQNHPPDTPVCSKDTEDHIPPTVHSIEDVPKLIHYLKTQRNSGSTMNTETTTSLKQPKTFNSDDGGDYFYWYSKFKQEIFRSLRCDEYSMLDNPIAMIVVASSTEVNPIRTLQDLSSLPSFPSMLQDGYFDPNIPIYYLLLHDNTESTSNPDHILSQFMSNRPNSKGSVLCFNSIRTTSNSAPKDIWSEHPHVRFQHSTRNIQTVKESRLGQCLSDDDVSALSNFVRNFGLHIVIPSLESRMFTLNETVSSLKKGMKNVIKSWWRKPKEVPVRTASSSLTYRYDSIESQTRLLADTAFLVCDYELALSMYRLVREDYKADKCYYHLGSVNEMIALCLYLINGNANNTSSFNQITNVLSSASESYCRLQGPLAARYHTRASVLAFEIWKKMHLKHPYGQFMEEASALLIKASTMDQGICSAVLLELAGLCDLLCFVPKFRKYGFRMVMAGHMYQQCSQLYHAIRCYSHARSIYSQSQWCHIEDHINFILARQMCKLDKKPISLLFYLKLIGTGRQSLQQQKLLLEEFHQVVVNMKETEGSQEKSPYTVDGLDLPQILTDKVKVYAISNASLNVEDYYHNGKTDDWIVKLKWRREEDMSLQQQLFLNMKSSDSKTQAVELIEAIDVVMSQQELQKRVHHKNNKGNSGGFSSKFINLIQSGYYGLDEKVYVELSLDNALSCDLLLDSIELYCNSSNVESEVKRNICISGSSRTTLVFSVMIHQFNKNEVLRIEGIRWQLLNKDVQSQHHFQLQGKLLQQTLQQRSQRLRADGNHLLTLKSHSPQHEHLPWLGVSSITDKQEMDCYVGQIVKVDLCLCNKGKVSLDRLYMQYDSTFLIICSASNNKFSCSYKGSGSLLEFNGFTLAPQESHVVPLYIRCSKPGMQSVQLLFHYSNDQSSIAREVHLEWECMFLPCVSLSSIVRPSYSTPGEYVLGLTTTSNMSYHSCESFIQLEQLVVISRFWRIVPFSASKDNGYILGSQEASTHFFRVIPVTNSDRNHTSYLDLYPSSKNGENDENNFYSPHGMDIFYLEHSATFISEMKGKRREKLEKLQQRNSSGFRTIQSLRRENKCSADELKDSPRTTPENVDIREADFAPEEEQQQSLFEPNCGIFLTLFGGDLNLSLIWSVRSNQKVTNVESDNLLYGQENVFAITVCPPNVSRRCPLNITLHYEPVFLLNTEKNLIVTFKIQNSCELSSTPVSFVIEMLRPNESQVNIRPANSTNSSNSVPGSSSNKEIEILPHVYWIGIKRKLIRDLYPGKFVELELQASFMCEGIYDLNRFRIIVSSAYSSESLADPEKSTVFVFPTQYLVTVKRDC